MSSNRHANNEPCQDQSVLETYLDLLDLCYFEVTEAFGGLADENLWKRPAPALLSVGELAAHIAYGEALRFSGENSDGSADRDMIKCKVKSPILDVRFRYYTTTVDTAPTPEQLALGATTVLSELTRVHDESMVHLKERNPDLDSPAPEWHGSYRELLKYLVFHASYHIGQMYSVRHLLGDETPNN